MGQGDHLGRGRLRSAWTHRVGGGGMRPYLDSAGMPDAPLYTEGTHQMPLGPGDYSDHQHQHLQALHHPHSSRGGAAPSGAGADPQDSDTPRKLNPALTLLTHQQQQLFSSRGRALFTSVDREILCNALACAGASMADPLMSMVDSYYAGKLGTTALAALGSNGALFSVLYFLCFTALAVLCTQAMASANSRGDAEGAGRGFIQAAAATLVVSSVLVTVLLSAPEALLGMFQNDAEVLALAKTYCMIRALSLPAALSINVSQAAFRSMLDLTTPFCIVMAVNAANYLLNELLMVVFPYGMAGCGWASVISQYMGALLFAAVIFRRRHKFGIPEALACAEDRFHEQRSSLARSAGGGAGAAASTGGSSTLVAKKLGGGGSSSRSGGLRSVSAGPGSKGTMAMSPHKRGLHQQQQQHHHGAGRAKRHSRTSSADRGGSSPQWRGISPRRSRESSGTLRIDLTAFEAQLAGENRSGGGEHGNSYSPHTSSRRRSNRFSSVDPTAAAFGGQVDVLTSSMSGSITHRHHPSPHQQEWSTEQQQQPVSAFAQQELPPLAAAAGLLGSQQQQQHHQAGPLGQLNHNGHSRLATAAAAAGQAAANCSSGFVDAAAAEQQRQQQQQQGGGRSSGGGHFQLHRWDSAGSESKLPRYLVGGVSSSWGRLLLLLRSLDWVGFVRRFAGMTTRGLLILSTYTSANLVAAKGGTAMMAAHQVVQQQQQLQMSFAWSFLHVGQSMTANLFHSISAVSGPKAARRLSERIVGWAFCSCILLACGTFTFRQTLPTIFSKDEAVQELVLSAAAPAALMLALGWNNALEGCLLAADEQPFVVRMYPVAVAAALTQLARGYWAGAGLPGVWVALMTYYLVLLVGFAGRYWVYRGKL